MVWLIVIVIVIAAGVAVLAAIRLRRDLLRRMIRLEIANQGNMLSHYQLRAEGPGDTLTFRFSLEGDVLPEQTLFVEESTPGTAPSAPTASATTSAPEPAGAPGTGAKGGQKMSQAMSFGGSIADVLSTLASILPRSVAAPMFQAASRLRHGQVNARRAQQLSGQVNARRTRHLSGRVTSLPPSSQKGVASAGQLDKPAVAAGQATNPAPTRTWAETPSVLPGESLNVDLLVRSASSDRAQHHAFRVISRSVEGGDEAGVSQEGSVQIEGGFWARKYLPHLLILAVFGLLLVFVYLAAQAGLLV